MADLNVQLFNDVIDHISEDVRRLHMADYGLKLIGVDGCGFPHLVDESRFPPCGTICCFAGWSVLLRTDKDRWPELFGGNGRLHSDRTYSDAKGLLGLTADEANLIFDGAVGTPEEQFAIVKVRIAHVISERVAKGETMAQEIRV